MPQQNVSIPDDLLPLVIEWADQLIFRAGDQPDSDAQREQLVEAVHRRAALLDGTLSTSELTELVQGAAGWQDVRWPATLEEVVTAEEQLLKTRRLLEVHEQLCEMSGAS